MPWQLPDTIAVFPLRLDGNIETVGACSPRSGRGIGDTARGPSADILSRSRSFPSWLFFFPLLFPQPLGQKSNPREVMKTNKASVTKEQLNRNDHGFLYYDFELSMIHVMRV